MKRGHKQGLPSRQHGFSLLELLIATSIGMVITVGAIAVFANSTNANKTTEAQSRMNEDAQAALSLLSREIKMAGYTPGPPPPPQPCNSVPPLTLHGCSGMLKADANSASDDKLTCEISSSSQPHSLFLRYEADRWNTAASAGIPTDCLGSKLKPLKDSPNIAENRYYIGTSQVIRAPSLYCKGNGGSTPTLPQPMIENIEDLKFSFGTATMPAPAPAPAASASSAPATQSCEPSKQIAGYLSATEVEKLAPTQTNEGISKAWNQVLTVQICIVVRSEAMNLVVDNASSTYTKCDGTQDTSQTDRRLRRAYTTTVALRNRPK